METVADFIFLGSKIAWMVNAATDLKDTWSLEEKLWQNWQHIQKQRHHFAIKGLYGQSYSVSSSHVWMWEFGHKESWLPKNWCFKLWCWRKLLRVHRTSRRSNQSVLKKINPEYSLEGLMLKLKFQYFGPLKWRTDSLEKTLMLGKTEDRRKRGWQRINDGWMVSRTQWTYV